MDFAQALHELLRRPGWLVLGAVVAVFAALSTAYDINGIPPRLDEKTLSLGTASTTVLVDTPKSSITNVAADLKPLAARAAVFARLAGSRPVRQAIASEVGLRETALRVDTPIEGDLPRAGGSGSRDRRISSILEEDRQFRVGFIAQTGLPTITVTAQAPRVPDAIKLADASASAFKKYIEGVQVRQRQPLIERVSIRQLGPAEGGLVAKEINRQLAVMTLLAAFVGWCLALLAVTGVARNLAAIRAAEHGADEAPAQPAA